ncbi:glutamate-5-semialdehyde dehydrogenase [Spirulina sp. CS-785/01]|uniref:glutamate-5-semialdehyde dehydrogenase n=1 Tax=Spirulina sp. CS-785/01 TaxID=3021716 RepID=UPI003FA766AB
MTQNPETSPSAVVPLVQRADQASLILAQTIGKERSRGLSAIARGLKDAQSDILEANTLDLETSRDMAIPSIIQDWLRLTPERIQQAARLLEQLGEQSDPILQMRNAPYPMETSQTYCQLMPLGVVAFIYEAFPELAAIAAGFCWKAGNSVVLRGSGNASHTNGIIAQVLQNAVEDSGLPPGSVEVISAEQGISIQNLVTQDQYLNLVIPYGRNSLVQQVSQLSTTPVLRAAIGNCYLYCSPSGDVDLLRWMLIDSHASEPDPVNAIEKVLINRNSKYSSLPRLFTSLKEKGFELRGDQELVENFPDELKLAKDNEWGNAYLKKIVAFKVVADIGEAISWINRYSSGHADCLVTESYGESRQFAQGINSALIYINFSPRFSRNPKRGDAVFLGISNQKGQRRGLISLESLTTIKQVVQGTGY